MFNSTKLTIMQNLLLHFIGFSDFPAHMLQIDGVSRQLKHKYLNQLVTEGLLTKYTNSGTHSTYAVVSAVALEEAIHVGIMTSSSNRMAAKLLRVTNNSWFKETVADGMNDRARDYHALKKLRIPGHIQLRQRLLETTDENIKQLQSFRQYITDVDITTASACKRLTSLDEAWKALAESYTARITREDWEKLTRSVAKLPVSNSSKNL